MSATSTGIISYQSDTRARASGADAREPPEHYLPQFLLRGFAARVAADQYHAYQFRLGAGPHLTNVRNVAGEHGFYGQVGATEVEQILQDRENFYAPLLSAFVSQARIHLTSHSLWHLSLISMRDVGTHGTRSLPWSHRDSMHAGRL